MSAASVRAATMNMDSVTRRAPVQTMPKPDAGENVGVVALAGNVASGR